MYCVAPLTLDHVNVGVIETPVAPFAGDIKVGAEGVGDKQEPLLHVAPLGQQ